MKFAIFIAAHSAAPHLGLVDDEAGLMLDLTAAGLPKTLVELIEEGRQGLAKVADLEARTPRPSWIPLTEVTLCPPLQMRRNIFCVGKNYRSHAQEFHASGFDANSSASKSAIPAFPVVFSKAPTSVIATLESIPSHLDDTQSVDYEGELGVVIGRGGRAITREAAMEHVFGFTIINDVTSRNLQRDHVQWFIGKSIDGFCPMGPWVATRDDMMDLSSLSLRTFVDGDMRQQARFSDMIFDIPTLIETISKRTTLLPGDVIATGTPEGVGIGFKPPKFLQPGQIVRIEVDGIGTLENPVA